MFSGERETRVVDGMVTFGLFVMVAAALWVLYTFARIAFGG